MPAVTAFLGQALIVGGVNTGVSIGTALAIATTVASVTYSQVQANQQRKALDALAARNRGFGITSREPAAVRRVIYGTSRVGGTIVYIAANQLAEPAPAAVVLRFENHSPTYLRHIQPITGKSFQKRHGRRLVDAIHEAGHVVFAKLSGHRVHWVSTERDVLRECLGGDDINAATGHSDAHLPPGPDRYMSRIMVAVAGRVVENWFCGTREPGFPEIDANEASRCASMIVGPRALELLDMACNHVLACLSDPLIAEGVTVFADAIMRKDPLEEHEIDAIWADLLRRHNRPTSLPSEAATLA